MQKEKLNTTNPHSILYQAKEIEITVLGGLRKELDSLRITAKFENKEKKIATRQKLDLYEQKQVQKISKNVAEKLDLRPDLIETELSKLTDLLEEYRNQLFEVKTEPKEEIKLSEEEEKEAINFLKQKNLIKRYNDYLGRSLVGEELNRIFLFICTTSYKRGKPLHVLCQASSGMGKTHLQESIAKVLPPEEVIEVTRMTDYAFYRCESLHEKAFFIEDIDGLSSEAMYALREIQSKGKLTVSINKRDEQGNSVTSFKTLTAVLTTVAATTKGEIYEDNSGRSFILSIDESEEQTKKIISYQDKKSAGKINHDREAKARTFIQNTLRVLQKKEVVNPYAELIQLPIEAHKVRRLNHFFKTFMEQITWLHQFQREQDEKKRLISTKEDVKIAIDLFIESLVLKVDELTGTQRSFFERLKIYVKEQAKANHEEYTFTRREVRQALRISKTQQHRYFTDLIKLEYLQKLPLSDKGQTYKILVWDNQGKLREKVRTHLYEHLNKINDSVPFQKSRNTQKKDRQKFK